MMSAGGKWGLIWLMIATVFAWQQVLSGGREGRLVLWPGGEDGLFIQTKEGGQVLVNGGGSRDILQKLSLEMPPGDKQLDLVILTSLTEDHLTGLVSVLENYEVDGVLWSGAVMKGPLFQTWEEGLAAEGAEVIIAQAGRKITLGSSSLEVLAPQKNLHRQQLEDPGGGEMVWRLEERGRSFLFLGRISSQLLAALEREKLKAEIVEASHLQKTLPWSFWLDLHPSLVIVSGAFPEGDFLPGLSLRQTEREGKIVVNF